MDLVKFFAVSTEDRCEYYQKRISEHTPPANDHDREMIQMYQSFLDRNKLENVLIRH